MKIQLHKTKTIWSFLFIPNYEGFKYQPEWIVLFSTQIYFLEYKNSWKPDAWTLLFIGALLSFCASLNLRVHWNTRLIIAGTMKPCIFICCAFIMECTWILHLTSGFNTYHWILVVCAVWASWCRNWSSGSYFILIVKWGQIPQLDKAFL